MAEQQDNQLQGTNPAEIKYAAVAHPDRAKMVFAAHDSHIQTFPNPLAAMQEIQMFMAIASAATTADFNDNGQADYKDLIALFKATVQKIEAFKTNAPKLTLGNAIVELTAFTNDVFTLYNQASGIVKGDWAGFTKQFPAVFGAIKI